MRYEDPGNARGASGRIVPARKLLELADVPAHTGGPAHTGLGDGPSAPDPAKRSSLISPRVVTGTVRIAETLLVAGIGLAIWAWYIDNFTFASVARYVPVIATVSLSLMIAVQIAGMYTVHALVRLREQAARITFIWMVLLGALAAYVFFSKGAEGFSRVWLASWFWLGLTGLLSFRFAVSRLVRRWNASGQLVRRAVLVGGGDAANELVEALAGPGHDDLSIIGIFDDRADDRSPRQVGSLRKLGNIAELVWFARNNRVDLLIVTLPLTAEARMLQLMKRLWVLPVDIRLSAYTQKLRYRPRAYSYIGNVPMLDVMDKPLSGWNIVLKAAEDKVISTLALVALAPLMVLIAIAIKIDSKGPVLFRQKRFGFNNELIEVFKFRSMYTGACDAKAETLVTRNDARVTPIGRLLRKASLDELPQLFNVLNGSLSLVGPRPHATHAKAQDRLYTEVVEGYFARHRVKPGITGWAQINGWRGETDTTEKIHRRVEHDLYYIENWSLLFDLAILAKTPFALFETENAY